MLPGHPRWARFLRDLQYVVVDECHRYRGVFGSHVAPVLRRLRRVCAHYGADPVFVLASATVVRAGGVGRAAGRPRVVPVDRRRLAARRAAVRAVGAAADRPGRARTQAPVRRTATAEAADLLTDLVADGVRTRGLRPLPARGRDRRRRPPGGCSPRSTPTWSSGSPPTGPATCRRSAGRWRPPCSPAGCSAWPRPTRSSSGVDIAGLDAVLLAGYPGHPGLAVAAGRPGRPGRAGRAGGAGRPGRPAGHLPRPPPGGAVRAAGRGDGAGPGQPARARAAPVRGRGRAAAAGRRADRLRAGRRAGGRPPGRAAGCCAAGHPGCSGPGRSGPATWPTSAASAAGPVGLVEEGTGRLLGTVDGAAAHATVHAGAVYVHQGETYLVPSSTSTEQVARMARADAGLDDGRPRRHRHRGRRDRPVTASGSTSRCRSAPCR